MKRQKGFTLIELIVVIIILGILAAFAVPRYFSLEKSARAAVVKGLSGSIKAAAELVHGTALVEVQNAALNGAGTSSVTSVVSTDGTVVDIVNSGATGSYRYYPTATSAGIGNAIQGASDFDVSYVSSGITETASFAAKGVANSSTCKVVYTYDSVGSAAHSITEDITDCS